MTTRASVAVAMVLLSASLAASADPILSDPGPVAVAEASAQTIVFDASNPASGTVAFRHNMSFHPNPNLNIIDYEWLFDVDVAALGNIGSWFGAFDWGSLVAGTYSSDGRAYHSADPLAKPHYTFTSLGTHYAALRVVDNSNPMKLNIDVVRVDLVPAPMPEPGSLLLVAAGLAALLGGHRRSST